MKLFDLNSPEPTSFRTFRSRMPEMYRRGALTYNDVRPLQLAASWRIIRAHAICKGQLIPQETLSSLPKERWYLPMPDASGSGRSDLAIAVSSAFSGLSLLPTQQNCPTFIKAISIFNSVLPLEELPSTALYGMDDERTILSFFPSHQEILDFEAQLLEDLSSTLLAKGHLQTRKAIQKIFYNVSKDETSALIRLTRDHSVSAVELNAAEDQKIMVARLEDYITRAQDETNLSAEMNALKTLANVQGLGKVDPEDTIKEITVLARVLAVEERKTIECSLSETSSQKQLSNSDVSSKSDYEEI